VHRLAATEEAVLRLHTSCGVVTPPPVHLGKKHPSSVTMQRTIKASYSFRSSIVGSSLEIRTANILFLQ